MEKCTHRAKLFAARFFSEELGGARDRQNRGSNSTSRCRRDAAAAAAPANRLAASL